MEKRALKILSCLLLLLECLQRENSSNKANTNTTGSTMAADQGGGARVEFAPSPAAAAAGPFSSSIAYLELYEV